MLRFFVLAAFALALGCTVPVLADTVGTITGTVTRDGRGSANVVVHLYGDRFAQAATTDARGRFVFARVPFGNYTLHANVGGAPAVADVAVTTGAVVSVVLVPTSAIKTIGMVGGGTRGVRGTPVSENAILPGTIASLPRGDSLNALVQSVPGVVRFSYDEPVAHGFHGLTYELDGAPLPQSTSSTFSELVDPRNVQAVDVFTGAFPAEFGGSRMGAVVNIVSRPPEPAGPPAGAFTLGAGTYGTAETRLNESFHAGAVGVSVAANESRSNRGLDAPTSDATLQHDHANLSDQFLRIVAPAGSRNQLAFDLSNQFAAYQIPINTNPHDPNNAFVSAPGTDDVQREYDRFASLSFTHTSKDGLGFAQIVPWARSSRIAYDGDLAKDELATFPDPDTGIPAFQNGLRQDQRADYLGVRASLARSSDIHAFKTGLDVSRETYSDTGFIELAGGAGRQTSDVAQAATLFGVYLQDRWALGQRFALNYGLRFDHSTGFVGGSQLSPRLEVNYSFDRATVFHAYAGRLYAAPSLEDTRHDAIVTQTTADANPPYDLKPERDSYVEFGLAHTFHPGLSMYANAWQRNALNVLDTTQLLNTPLFAVFNNAIGHANGLELRVQGDTVRDSFYLSTTLSEALAGGISGSTFLFPPAAVSDLTLNPEDHDQAVAINAAYTHRFGRDHRRFVTLEPEFGTGYPVNFQNGSSGRLPEHLIVNASFGRLADPAAHRLGYSVVLENMLDHQYLIKVNNGFNTTQWAAGRRIVFRLTTPF
jgi:outer membrane receptor protein involved in Fe transport